jgi:hypothetical protein
MREKIRWAWPTLSLTELSAVFIFNSVGRCLSLLRTRDLARVGCRLAVAPPAPRSSRLCGFVIAPPAPPRTQIRRRNRSYHNSSYHNSGRHIQIVTVGSHDDYITRRSFGTLAVGGALGGMLALAMPAGAKSPFAGTQAAGVYRLKVGSFEVRTRATITATILADAGRLRNSTPDGTHRDGC